MSPRRAVVVGGAGFLGSHLCERLLSDGAEVVCVDNHVTGSPANIAHLRGTGRFAEVRQDVTAPIDIPGDVDAVLHFASPASPIDYLRLPVQTLEAGAIGTQRTLELARAKGARYVLASSSEVYGDPEEHPQREDYWGKVNPVGPRSVYNEAKRYAEALTTAYRRTHDVNSAILRIFNTYGSRMRPNDGRMVPTFIHQALTSQPMTVAGDGSQTRSACHVDDLVEAVIRTIGTDAAGPINIGSTEELSVLDLARKIRRLVGSSSELRFVPRPVDDPSMRRPDISLATKLLGWEPRVGLDEGLRRTIDWCRESDSLTRLEDHGPLRSP